MIFGKPHKHPRAEPIFVFHDNRQSKTKTARDTLGDGEPFTIPSFLRAGPASTRTKKKWKMKKKKTASGGWYDDDFARIAESAKPRYMASEPVEPHFARKPGAPDIAKSNNPAPDEEAHAEETLASADAQPQRPMPDDDLPPDIFIFENLEEQESEEEAEDAYDDEEDDEEDPAPAYADYFSNTPPINTLSAPYDKTRLKTRRGSLGNILPALIIVAGLGLYGAHYLRQSGSASTTATVATDMRQRPPEAAAEVKNNAQVIVPTGPSNRTGAPDTTTAPSRVTENGSAVPVPKHRPAAQEKVARNQAAAPVRTEAPPPQRDIVLAPGPHPLRLPSASGSTRSNLSDRGSSGRRAMLTGLAANVQHKLAMLGYGGVPQSGRLDAATRNVVRVFQTNSGLPATGEVDSKTLQLLNNMSMSAAR